MKVNDVIKSYKLLEEIGEGGFGIVYRAWHQTIQREVAMKVILPLFANEADFIERFEQEAQLVAKLEHPNIVPLYDFWRDPSGAYLVMRYIRGGSLGNAIDNARVNNQLWDIERAAKLLNQIASALHNAHRNKIVHQDIKPANILLDDDGNAYLTDFGIARVLDSDINLAQDANNVMHGSPKYISPEHLKRTEITAKSDIYSLGILMYEVLTGEPPYDSNELLELLQMHLKRRIPSLQEKRPDLPEALNAPLRQATTRSIAERYESVLDFANDFNTIVQQIKYGSKAPILMTPRRAGGAETVINPFKGLAAFQERDVDDFFGRSELTQRLLDRLIERNKPFNRLLAIVGPSGSGKSSVVRAGVIPKIRAGAIAGMTFYTAAMIPGINPMRSLEGAVLRVAARASDDFLKKLSQPKFDLTEILNLSLPQTGEMLLIIDQFEEVFTLAADKEIRDHFLQTVFEAVNHPNSRVRVIVTMRADFTGHALVIPGWGEMIQNRTELIPNMSVAELREAIEKPAERVGLDFESGLTDQLIADVQREVGSLPLLQYTLSELFERRKANVLTHTAYKELEGISGALAKRADETYDSLTDEQKFIAQRVLLRLVTLGEGIEDTRRREFLRNLFSMHPDPTIVDEILIKFQNGHLIARDYDDATRDIVVEVAHETLIRRWQLLRKWLDENRDALRLQASLTGEVRQWLDSKQSVDFLARGERLALFRQLLNNNLIALSDNEREYLIASDRASKLRQLRRQQRLAILVAISLIATLAAVFASIFWRNSVLAEREAVAQRDRANQQTILSRSRELAASALLSTAAQPDRAVLLGLQSIATSPTFEARNSLLVALQSQQNFVGYLNGHTDQVRAVVLNPDKTLLASGSRNSEVIIWDMATRQPLHHLEGHTGRVNAIAFNAAGTLMASTGFDGQVLVWDTESWTQRHRLTWTEDTGGNGWSLAFSADGATIALGDSSGQVILWDADTGDQSTMLTAAEDDPIYSIAYSPDGTMLATGGGDNRVTLWDTSTLEPLEVFTDHTNWILDLAFSPDGRLLASSSADKNIRFWDTVTLEGIGGLTGHENGVRSILFTNNGLTLISADLNGVVRVNDLSDRQNTFAINSPEKIAIWSIDLLDNNLIIGGETDSMFIVSLANQPTFPFNRIAGTTDDVINRVAFSPDGTQVATGGNPNDFTISLWNLETGEQDIIEEHQSLVNDLVWEGNRVISVDFDGRVVIWENGTIRTFETEEPILSVAAHGDTLALGDSQGNISIWNISEAEENIATIAAHENLVLTLDFSPDGSQLVSGSRDATLKLWDVANQTAIGATWAGHSDDVLTVTFSPDGQYVASGSRDNTVIIWEVATGQPIDTPLIGHQNWVTDLSYSPDGKILVSSSTDNTLRMWDVQSLRQLGLPLRGDSNFVNSVDFSADGAQIVSAGQSGNIYLWNAALNDWVSSACAFANRPISATEEQEFFAGNFAAHDTCPTDS
jgi:WD40 repeat protein/serine/threonine protein kinase